MDYKNKYKKYKNKYLSLKNTRYLKGGNIFTIQPVKLKGIAYFGHLQNSITTKNLILIGEVHVELDKLDPIEKCKESKKIIDWLNDDIISQFKDTPDKKLDIFFEWPYKISYKEEKKEINMSKFREINSTLYNLATLIIEKPENTRIHTFDFRDAFFEITTRIGELDKIFRHNIYPNTESYIIRNHIKLFQCLDELIKLFFMIFFDKEKIQLTVESITNGLDLIFRPYYLTYSQIFGNLKQNIENMNEILEEIQKNLISLDKINFADFDGEYIDGILPNKLFVKNYNKIDPIFQSQYMKQNRKLMEIKEDFNEKYRTFKELFAEHIIKYTDEEINIENIENIIEFEENYIIHDFTSINNCQDLFISFMSEVVDLYTIGRILKSYVKTGIYYAGLSHVKNIFKKLQEYDFELKYESNPINKTTWENIGDYDNYCIDIEQISI